MDQSLLYQYKSGDQSRSAPTQAREYNEETDNPIQQAERAEDKILAQIIRWVAQAEQALATGDLEEVARCLVEIKKFAQTEAWKHVNQETINKLEQRLARAKANQINQTESIPYKLIIGSIGIVFLVVTLMFLAINKLLKKLFLSKLIM